MSTHKNFDKICVVVLVLTLLLTVLFMNGEKLGLEVVVDEDDEAHSGSVYFTANDLNGAWDTSGATRITLEGDSASVSGSGAYAYGGDVIVSSAGLYVLSGSLTDGSVIVDAHNRAKVWLLFDGVDLSCSDDACLRVDQADKVFLTLAAGSENSMNGPVIFSEAAEADGTDGVVYAHDDLTINGSGSLTVNAWYRHGIVAKDDLVITGGTIFVHAQADGIRSNDSLRVCGASITVEAGDDGITASGSSSLPAAPDNGYLYIESGTFSVTAEDDALSAYGALYIGGGDFALAPVGDGIRSDTSATFAGGSFRIDNCYEGVEAPRIEMSGGTMEIYPRDDGFNASASMISSGTPQVLISGGSLTIVNATATDADGIDSNGDVLISGGEVFVSLPGMGVNNAIDVGAESGGVIAVSGGRVIACGSASMAVGFDESSTQCSVFYALSAVRGAGTALRLTDAAGAELLSREIPCSFTSLAFSAPELALGESYTLRIGDKEETLTLGSVVTSLGTQNGLSVMGGGFTAPHGGGLDGGRPEGPDGMEPPDMGERPEPPGMGERQEPPSGGFDGGRPAPPVIAGTGVSASSQSAVVRTASTVTPAQWGFVAAALLVLALGILLGVKYEPKD